MINVTEEKHTEGIRRSAGSAAEVGSSTVGYRLILPPTWVMIPLREGTDAAIEAIVARQFDSLPRDKYGPNRRRLTEMLQGVAEKARKEGGLDLVFPIAQPWRVPVSAGIVMSERYNLAPSPDAAADLFREMANASGATQVDTNAGPAIRELTDHDPDADDADRRGLVRLRTVQHTWPVPERPGGFLIGTLSISGEANDDYAPVTEALTTLGDVMMQALTWDIPGVTTDPRNMETHDAAAS